eukprot:TRINITY_DN1760_c0_g7_i1.p1 TRINITY_DN1760_c0_g7~~TRINITY_DN1760_c0_g7_i1.p1  ORF type:complete len:596 (-),score=123.11 TRINITY_DN1760_c0_g7_i1:78-1865(-)
MSSTFQLQPTLPRLPVPDLHETLTKYVESIRPFASEAELKQTIAFVRDFAKDGGIGQELQRKLIERAKTEPNSWLERWWNELAYLKYRDPIVINVNYFYVLADDPLRTTQTSRAAGMIVGLMNYRQKIIDETLPIEGGAKSPMCMSQYASLFNSCRIPLPVMDEVRIYRSGQPHTGKIVVMRKNKAYAFEVFDETGKLLSESEIKHQLDAIINLDSSYPEETPISVLTGAHRDKWADAYSLLRNIPENAVSLEIIHQSAFVVCLDDKDCSDIQDLSRVMWHNNGDNRFYDKTVSLVVLPNGKAGFNCEHAIVDGSPTSNMADTVSRIVRKTKPIETPIRKLKAVSKLAFVITPQIKAIIQDAHDEVLRTIQGTDIHVLKINGLGKNFIKSVKVSPDAFAQMAIQRGFFKMYGRPVATYESASTRRFLHGRTEVVRSCSHASHRWTQAMEDDSISSPQKRQLLLDAINHHVNYMKDAVLAKGVDRHLFGLRLLAAELGYERPAIFNDSVYWRTCTWLVSTSQLSSDEMTGYGWGAVHPDGYGIAYSILENQLHFNIASFRESPHTSCVRLADSIRAAVNEMRNILQTQEATPKAKL